MTLILLYLFRNTSFLVIFVHFTFILSANIAPYVNITPYRMGIRTQGTVPAAATAHTNHFWLYHNERTILYKYSQVKCSDPKQWIIIIKAKVCFKNDHTADAI